MKDAFTIRSTDINATQWLARELGALSIDFSMSKGKTVMKISSDIAQDTSRISSLIEMMHACAPR